MTNAGIPSQPSFEVYYGLNRVPPGTRSSKDKTLIIIIGIGFALTAIATVYLAHKTYKLTNQIKRIPKKEEDINQIPQKRTPEESS